MTAKSKRRIRSAVRKLLDKFEVKEPSVPVRKIARGCGVRIAMVEPDAAPGFRENVLGFLYQNGTEKVIGVNKDLNRKAVRFIIAHELGHLMLQEPREIHVDRRFSTILRRKKPDSDLDDMVANHFSSELLMPTEMLLPDVESTKFELPSSTGLWKLSKRYEVDVEILALRLIEIGFSLTPAAEAVAK